MPPLRQAKGGGFDGILSFLRGSISLALQPGQRMNFQMGDQSMKLLHLAFLVLWASLGAVATDAQEKKPNIVFILADDKY